MGDTETRSDSQHELEVECMQREERVRRDPRCRVVQDQEGTRKLQIIKRDQDELKPANLIPHTAWAQKPHTLHSHTINYPFSRLLATATV